MEEHHLRNGKQIEKFNKNYSLWKTRKGPNHWPTDREKLLITNNIGNLRGNTIVIIEVYKNKQILWILKTLKTKYNILVNSTVISKETEK